MGSPCRRRGSPRFNPYRVFSSAETGLDPLAEFCRVVSIPIGFSHQLRQNLEKGLGADGSVSIPIGFSHQLRLCSGGDSRCLGQFQSLSGFLIS